MFNLRVSSSGNALCSKTFRIEQGKCRLISRKGSEFKSFRTLNEALYAEFKDRALFRYRVYPAEPAIRGRTVLRPRRRFFYHVGAPPQSLVQCHDSWQRIGPIRGARVRARYRCSRVHNSTVRRSQASPETSRGGLLALDREDEPVRGRSRSENHGHVKREA